MAAPPAPTIFIRPKPFASSIIYTVNPVDANISSFNLAVSGPGASNYSFQATSNWYKYKVTDLSISSEYSASVYQIDSNGLTSPPTVYRTVETGNDSGPVQNLSSIVNGSNITLTWQPPANPGGATIQWYVIRNLSQSIKYNTPGHITTFTTALSAGSNTFSVEAVNDPGYSPSIYNSTFLSSGIPFNWILFKYTQLASNAVRSAANVTDWDARATSDTSRQTNFSITGAPMQTNLQSMFGMASSSNPSFPVYNQMPHCIYTAANATLYLFDNASFGPSLGSYSSGDLLTMTFSGSNATYKKNGTTIYTKTFTPNINLYLCATAGIALAGYSNITYTDS